MLGKELPEWALKADVEMREILGWTYAYVHQHLRAYVKGRCPINEELDDILLDTAMCLAEVVKRSFRYTNFLSYAKKTASNVIGVRIRAERRLRRIHPPRESYCDRAPESLEMEELIGKISRHLTKPQLQICRWLYVEGRADIKCAADLGLSLKSFRARKARLHKALRRWCPTGYS